MSSTPRPRPAYSSVGVPTGTEIAVVSPGAFLAPGGLARVIRGPV